MTKEKKLRYPSAFFIILLGMAVWLRGPLVPFVMYGSFGSLARSAELVEQCDIFLCIVHGPAIRRTPWNHRKRPSLPLALCLPDLRHAKPVRASRFSIHSTKNQRWLRSNVFVGRGIGSITGYSFEVLIFNLKSVNAKLATFRDEMRTGE